MTSRDKLDVWRDCIRAWYPKYETKTYFIPPVVITRIPFDKVTVAGQSVLVPQRIPDQVSAVPSSSTQVKVERVQECQTRDDLALQRVLRYLQERTSEQNEPMFVISQLQFFNYLGEPSYADDVKQFLRPQNLRKDYRRGDFDILVIHRHYGIITGEIKSVLSIQQQLQLSPQEVDRKVTDRVRNAIKQLNKSEVVLREITKDLEPKLAINKILILPYVTTDVLIRVVSSDEQFKQDLINCLQTTNFEQALQCCLLAENFSSSGTEMVNNQQPEIWWSTFKAFRNKGNLTPDLYLDLLAKFCGPATTISVYWPRSPRIMIRTEVQGVAITGERMTLLVLTPEQVNLLNSAPNKVLLTGPPGVGKTVMLVLMALKWLRQGHDVHLVSLLEESIASTRMINQTIQASMRNDPTTPSVVGTVHLHEFDFDSTKSDVDRAINTLTATGGRDGPYVVCDEFGFCDNCITSPEKSSYQRFVIDLCTHLPNICLWVASLHHGSLGELQKEQMTIPLRCPPAVLIEIQKSVDCGTRYTKIDLVTPCDGPNVIHLSHQGIEHPGRWPLECVKCGQSIATILQELGVQMTYSSVHGNNSSVTTAATTFNTYSNTANVSTTTTCPPLQYRDVFVLTHSLELHDDVKDDAGHVTSSANGIVRGLRSAGIPVRVIRTVHESTDVYNTAENQSNMVTVADYDAVRGLERKVVVIVPCRAPLLVNSTDDDQFGDRDRIHAMSRCTSQLVLVDVPLSDVDRHVAVQTTERGWHCCVS